MSAVADDMDGRLGRRPHAGMPPLDMSGPPLSHFEFWPARLFYGPVLAYAIWQMIRHRSIRVAALANPKIEAGGYYGESKAGVLDLAGPVARDAIARYVRVPVAEDATVDAAAEQAMAAAHGAGLSFPLVAKPDLGCRGNGVQRLADRDDLIAYLRNWPRGAAFMLQELVDAEGEAGVFWVRRPGEAHGRIISLTLKYFPYVVGDGRSTLRDLIVNDPRAGQIPHVYLPRHAERLDMVLPEGRSFRLAFAGSHSRGTIFRDGGRYVTEAMERGFDRVLNDVDEFHFGRIDVRFDSIEDLMRGDGFKILEINGAGGESTHIWDRNMTLWGAYKALFLQNRLMFEIGAANSRRGFRSQPWRDLLGIWKRQKRFAAQYPLTH